MSYDDDDRDLEDLEDLGWWTIFWTTALPVLFGIVIGVLGVLAAKCR